MNKRISVIIPCRNEAPYIAGCVHSILSNGYDPGHLEILVVDGESNDGTLEIVEALVQGHPQVRLISNPKRQTPFALNLGIEHSTGEYTLIAGAHSAFDSGYISTMVSQIESLEGAVAVGGQMRTEVKKKTRTSMAIKSVLASKFGVGNAHFRVGVPSVRKVDTVPFGLYRTAVLKEINGYDERLIRNHDIELSKRLLRRGGSIYLIPDVRCTYFARESFRQLAKNNYQNGKWNVLTVAATRDFRSLSVRHFVPLVFVLSLMLPVLGALVFPPLLFFALASVTAYLVAMAFVVHRMDRRETTAIHLVGGFTVLHVSYGFGSLTGCVMLPCRLIG